jgi:porin
MRDTAAIAMLKVNLLAAFGIQTVFAQSCTADIGCSNITRECGDGCSESTCRIFGQSTLTGDWFGKRRSLQDSGVTFRGTVTQFAFGIEGGINNPVVPALLGQGDTFKYTGRGEYDWIFDLEKLGGLPRGKLLVGAQHWWGQFGNVSLNTGALTPAVFPAFFPTAPNDPAELHLTDFLFTQPLSENLVVFAGKKNVIGTADQDIFAGGDGTDQFINQAFVANPAYLLALPYSSFTAGIVMPRKWGLATIYVWDPHDRTRDGLDPGNPFSDGVIVGSQVKVNTNFFDKPGEHHVGGIWKHVDLIDLSLAPPPTNGFPYPAAAPGVPTISDSYAIYYGFDQYMQVFPGERRGVLPQKPPRGWGFFGRASISDGNPTPFNYFLSLGIGGDSRMGSDRGDTFGVGWYYNGVSDEYGPAAKAAFGPRDGQAVEAYYKFQLTPWFAVTPDVQFIRLGFSNFTSGDDAFVYGVRVNMNL